MIVAAATLLVGGGLAAGAGLVPSAQRDAPATSAASAQGFFPASSASAAPLTQAPQRPPTGPVATALTRDVLDSTGAFGLFPDGAGWVSTASGVYRTLDDGATWVVEQPTGWTASAGVALVDGKTAYLASDGLPMVMAVTHTGGASWETATIDDRRIGGPPTLSFQSPMRGFATFFDDDAETRLRVYATTDGGHTWTGPVIGHKPTIEASLGKIQGPSGGVLYMISGRYDNRPFNDRIVLSLDGGATWRTRSFPIGAESPKGVQKWIDRFWVDPDGSIRMAIGAGEHRSIWSSRDDARTWHLETVLPRNTNVIEHGFLSASDWVLALDSGTGVRFTTDAGAHWHTRRTIDDTQVDLSTMTFASTQVGWAFEGCIGFRRGPDCLSGRAVLVSTKDGGGTWTPLGDPVPPPPPATPMPGQAAWAPAGDSVTGSIAARGPGVTATRLVDGRILAIGGGHGEGTASLYVPGDGQWTVTGRMVHARDGQATALLPDGRVMVIGGSYDGVDHGTTEFLDPTTGRWSRGPSMVHRKTFIQAVVLRDGRVLVVGTEPRGSFGTIGAEVYDPATGHWSTTGRPKSIAYGGSPLIVLRDGRVLRAGGDDANNHRLASVELYDPATGKWSATRRMLEPRDWPMATLLHDGRVLVAGGAHSLAGRSLPTTEIFDPATGAWTAAASMSTVHDEASLTLFADGRVLVAGGDRGGFDPIGTAEVYDPVADAWSSTAPLLEARYAQAAVALDDGSVLVVGGHGNGSFNYLGSAERYYPQGVPAS